MTTHKVAPHVLTRESLVVIPMVWMAALAGGTEAIAGDPTAFVQAQLWSDTPTYFNARFRITNAKAHGPGVGLTGNYVVITTSSNWEFEATHDVGLLEVTGATRVSLKMKGKHLVAPHPPEAAPNFLPEIVSKQVDLAPGKLKGISAWAGVDHPGDEDHLDTYGFGGEVRNRQVGQTSSISSSVNIVGRHDGESGSPLVSYRMCLRWQLFAMLTYDAANRSIVITASTPQVIDSQGCSTGVVEPLFNADPMLVASLAATQLTVLDMNPDGSFPITQGQLSLAHPDVEAELAATLAPSVVTPGSTPFFRLRAGTIVIDTNDEELPVSPVLSEVARQNILGDQFLPDPTGLVLKVETLDGDDLTAATHGFNQSVDIPVVLTLSSPAPVGGIVCDSIDINNDTSLFDPQDIDAFLSVYGEGPCIPEAASCNDIDFNNDGSVFDPCDIDSFLLKFAEGPCTPCGS